MKRIALVIGGGRGFYNKRVPRERFIEVLVNAVSLECGFATEERIRDVRKGIVAGIRGLKQEAQHELSLRKVPLRDAIASMGDGT